MDRFGSLEKVRLAKLDTSVVKGGSVQYHPTKAAYPAGCGVDAKRAGKAKRYSNAVKEAVKAGGNGGVKANAIQDLLENVYTHPRTSGRLSLSFLLEAPPDEDARKTLQDLVLIQKQDAKSVKHGLEFIKHYQAARGVTMEAYRSMREERVHGKEPKEPKKQREDEEVVDASD